MPRPACVRCGERAGWVGVSVNAALGIMKVTVGLAAGSHACVTDAVASALNVLTACSIFVSRGLTRKPSNERYPYGFGKAEFLSAGVVALVVIGLTIGMVVTSLQHIISTPQAPPRLMAGLAALVSVVANEALFRYFSCVGKELRSQTMIANAWSNRGEAFGSSAVIVGVVGAQFGFSHLDPIASLVVSAIIFKYSYGIVRDAVTGLMDRSLPPSALRELRQTIAGVDAVKSIRHLRARLVGDQVWVDVLLGADQTCTMQQCEELRARVDRAVRKATCGVGQVQIDFESA